MIETYAEFQSLSRCEAIKAQREMGRIILNALAQSQ